MAKANRLQILNNKLERIESEIEKYNQKIDSLFIKKESLLTEKETIEKDELWEFCQSSGMNIDQVISLIKATVEDIDHE